jgi:hypothetical protein
MSRLSALLDRTFPLRPLQRRLSRAASVARPVTVRIHRRASETTWSDVHLRKEGACITIRLNTNLIMSRPDYLGALRDRAGVVAHLLAATRPEIIRCRADISDGNHVVPPGCVRFCSNREGDILIPDPDFFEKRGYLTARQLAATGFIPWRERSDTVLWRGSSTGLGATADETMSAGNPSLRQRTRMCLLLRDVDRVSARIVNVVDDVDPAAARARMQAAGILGKPIEPATWLTHKFAIDIDGYSNAWENLMTRLIFGCCIIKIASAGNYRQWYYGDLIAGVHYVPVRSDMSDLFEKIDWCRSHPEECEAIAAAGRRLALEMTFEREMKRGLETLERSLAPG